MPDEPNILNYATPEPATFARNSRFVIVLLALVVPGLSSSLIRRSPKPCLLLCSTVLVAFLFFGPLWGEVLFPRTPTCNWGVYPFVLIYVLVARTSILLALKDRTKALSGIGVSPATECNTPVPPKTEPKP